MPARCRLVVALATTLLLPLPAHADGGCEFIPVAKPVKALAGSVAASDGMTPPYRHRLSKQGLTDIRNAYTG